MKSKDVQKRANSKPNIPKKGLSGSEDSVRRYQHPTPLRIVGFNWKCLILLSFIGMGAFNYYLLKEVRFMKGEMNQMNPVSAQDIRIILDQRSNPTALERDYFNQKIEGMRGDILDKISNIEKGSHSIEKIIEIRREPAASHASADETIKKMGQIDVYKYTVQNLRAYPKFRYFLSEQSASEREFRSEIDDIIKVYTKSNDIIGEDRSSYHRVLAFRDSMYDKHRGAIEQSNNNWKRIYSKGSSYAKR